MNVTVTSCVVFLLCLVCGGGLGGEPEARAAGRNQALPTADLLVDLARDYGLCCRGKQTAADVLHIKTLLQAALRLDPRNAQACVWLYELASLGDQPDEADKLLAQLVAADPTNVTAFTKWLEVGPHEVQTVEGRRQWLEGLLQAHGPGPNRALVHTHLARLALQKADREQARRHLDQALGVWPECPQAAMLELELVTPDSPPARGLRAVFQALRANPLQVELAWQAGLLLDECGFPDDAFTFYEHAISVHETAGTGAPLPWGRLLQLSRNALAREQTEDAGRYAQQAVRVQQGTYEASFYLYWLLEGRVPPPVLERFKAWLAAQFAAIEDPAAWPVAIVSQAAWFYCTIDTGAQPGLAQAAEGAAPPGAAEQLTDAVRGWTESVRPPPEKAERALRLAENAARRAPGDVFATRVLGWAQALNRQTEEARRTLEPIAKTDPYAAYQLAKLLRDSGDVDLSARVVRELAWIPPVGRARQLLDELGVAMVTSQPAELRFPEVAALVREFDRQLFEFHGQAVRFLKAEVKLDDSSPGPGEPWWAVLSLTNQGEFPITLGPDWMVNPVFLLSFHVEGDRQRDYPNLLTVSLDHACVIRPGETVQVRQTIDIGPLRRLSRHAPQRLQSMSISGILDPEQTADRQWQPSITGQRLRALSFVRIPANTTPEAWHARFSALKGGPARVRFQVLEVMAELLGEHQRARMNRLSYKPETIPADRIRRALGSALGSESWEIRVRALDALQVAGLDRALIDAAKQCLEHPHWAVRVMAVRLLSRLGPAFSETARRIVEADEDELVRDMARSYVERWSAEQSEPATQPTSRPQGDGAN